MDPTVLGPSPALLPWPPHTCLCLHTSLAMPPFSPLPPFFPALLPSHPSTPHTAVCHPHTDAGPLGAGPGFHSLLHPQALHECLAQNRGSITALNN